MITIALMVLFIGQLISFFFIILLNMKLSKFKGVEARQARVITEMDDAIGAYLIEMKEENNRLIQELTKVKRPSTDAAESALQQQEFLLQSEMNPKIATSVSKVFDAYSKQKAEPVVEKQAPTTPVKALSTFDEEVMNLHKKGYSIEDIAKQTQKGTTEIELLIKFHA